MTAAYLVLALCLIGAPDSPQSSAGTTRQIEYRVLATNRTSTLEREMNEAADAGYRYDAVMGGETGFGGNEVVAIMSRRPGTSAKFQYKLLATNRTSTMQRELQQAADAGFEYRGQTVFTSVMGGKEVACILERDMQQSVAHRYQYLLLATTRTSTMQKELQEAGEQGYEIIGMTVGKTAVGGSELVSIARRPVK